MGDDDDDDDDDDECINVTTTGGTMDIVAETQSWSQAVERQRDALVGW